MLKDTIISAFNYDGTLLKWIKKVEDALQNASASEFRVNKKGNATISFSIVFANGDTLESGDIILQQGESVTNATIRQGHLILTLSNGDELDAGDLGAVTGFSINESQHLIVTYQNGSTQDLGAIFTGNVNINGTLNATKVTGDEIVETMNGYSFIKDTGIEWTPIYAGVTKTGNKISFVIFGSYTFNTGDSDAQLARFNIPYNVGDKLFPYTLGSVGNVLDQKSIAFFKNTSAGSIPIYATLEMTKSTNTAVNINIRRNAPAGFENGSTYIFRYECTFLLSDNMAE